TRGRSFHASGLPAEGDGWSYAHACPAPVVCCGRSVTERGHPEWVDCRVVRSFRYTAAFTLDHGYSQYLSGLPGVGTFGGAAGTGGCLVLAEAARETLATGRKLLKQMMCRNVRSQN